MSETPDQGSSDVRRAAAPSGGSGWLPIATAPMDGTWIIVLMRTGQVWRASWGRDRQNEMHWCTDILSLAGCVVTHWMPLPSPPDGASNRRGSDDTK